MSKGKRKSDNKTEKNSKNKIVRIIILIVLLGVLAFSGYKLINYLIAGNKTNQIVETLSQSVAVDESLEDTSTEKYQIDWESLIAQNDETVGFIRVYGTSVEHVVVQAKDNDYYIDHDFECNHNPAGWIFADYRNQFDGNDKNIILYGHNMLNGTMFSSLKEILTRDWQEEPRNRYVVFNTPEENAIYEVFSVYQIEDEAYYITTNFIYDDFGAFVNKLKSRSFYNFGTEVGEDDSILTLSTCAYDKRYRIVLHAKKLITEDTLEEIEDFIQESIVND